LPEADNIGNPLDLPVTTGRQRPRPGQMLLTPVVEATHAEIDKPTQHAYASAYAVK